MSVAPGRADTEQVYLLWDYVKRGKFWRVHARQDAVLSVQETKRGVDEHAHGVLSQWVLAEQKTTMGFLSALPEPGYSKNFRILINERLLGDGLAAPRLRFQQGNRERDFSVQSDDGWHFDTHYKAPWLREMYRKFMHGDTWEGPPTVDFIESLIEAVRFNRPHWLVEAG